VSFPVKSPTAHSSQGKSIMWRQENNIIILNECVIIALLSYFPVICVKYDTM
jgi:hypothetical protein